MPSKSLLQLLIVSKKVGYIYMIGMKIFLWNITIIHMGISKYNYARFFLTDFNRT